MKKWGFIVILSGICALTAHAQETPEKSSSYPYWTISKGVQRLSFKNTRYVPAIVTTGEIPVSKGVQQLSRSRSTTRRDSRVQMTGYPTWTISKGVARFQAEQSSSK